MNQIFIAGHLGSDPETRFTPKGDKVTTFRVATNSRRGGKDETTWWRVTVWGESFDKMMPYLKKGSAAMVWGELLKPEIYVDKAGQNQISLEVRAKDISFSPFGKSGTGTSSETTQAAAGQSFMQQAATQTGQGAAQDHNDDDKLPF